MHVAAWGLLILGQAAPGTAPAAMPPVTLLSGAELVSKIKAAPPGYARKMVVELWLYPDGTRILELSTKCAPSEAFQVAAETRAFLAERGIAPAGAQTTKTRKALAYFSKQLQAT